MSSSRRLASAARERATPIAVHVDGRLVTCAEGETVAAALLAEDVAAFYQGVDDTPRTPFCNMGTCYECTVTIDGRPLQRACITPVQAAMDITTGVPR